MSTNTLETSAPRRTGLAIAFAIIASSLLFTVYRVAFEALLSFVAAFGGDQGLGMTALVLYLGAGCVAYLSGSVVALKVFPRAAHTGVFYGLATFIVITNVLFLFAQGFGLAPLLIAAFVATLQVGSARLGVALAHG